MDIIDEGRAVIQSVNETWYEKRVARVDILRLDMLHPVISGNKWFKLKKNIAHVIKEGYQTVLTFGGAYSNHLIATAAAAKAYGLQSVGVVRGLHAADNLTGTLRECMTYGMHLHFETRANYDRKNDAAFLYQLSAQFANAFIIPEGGANDMGRKGAGDMALLVPGSYTHVCLSVGSGTTFIGLRNALPQQQFMLGFAPMKQGRYLQDEILKCLDPVTTTNWRLLDDWHFGGFGKHNDTLISFMNEFYDLNQVPLDIVYTGKMMYGVGEMIRQGSFDPASRILCIHTGGLQGNAGVADLLQF